MARVLDLGCGSRPWIAKNYYLKNKHGFSTALHDRHMSVGRGSSCLFVDLEEFVLDAARISIGEMGEAFSGETEFRLADIRRMSLQSGYFDTVILSDLLSVPKSRAGYMYEHGDPGGFLPTLSNKEKLKIIGKAIKTLKQGGELIITVYQTPRQAESVLLELIRDSRLVIREEWGSLETFFDIGWDGKNNCCFYETVFVKGGQPAQPTRQALTTEQREILKNVFSIRS